MESARRAHRELRRYAQLKYPYSLEKDGPGFCRKPEMLFRWIENKLGRLPSDEITRVIEEEKAALEKALNSRAARHGVGAVERRGTGGEDNEEPNEEEDGTRIECRRAASAGSIT